MCFSDSVSVCHIISVTARWKYCPAFVWLSSTHTGLAWFSKTGVPLYHPLAHYRCTVCPAQIRKGHTFGRAPGIHFLQTGSTLDTTESTWYFGF
ncbi:Uncharacterized protein DAT39_006974 [Clarias magur]|uniref:Uncharacterized protein n=1 Tax=Clarias magur TaxID=1594786 RepID=A0A8J4U9B1_CLAMG|nr:Uncharacterized protein DAT39_006974 [Clarias magur]